MSGRREWRGRGWVRPGWSLALRLGPDQVTSESQVTYLKSGSDASPRGEH